MKNRILTILLLALAALTANAQDDFNPTLPGEPNAKYKVTVGISNAAAGNAYLQDHVYWNWMDKASFSTGETISVFKDDAWLSPDATEYYQFKYWTLNGAQYSTESSFEYTVGQENADFVAVYEVMDPDEVTSKVFIEMSPADACYSYTSNGERYFEDDYAYIYCYENSGFEFLGWYEGDRLVSSEKEFNYLVGENNVTLTAKFEYNPVIPGEPDGGDQDDVDNGIKGDVNNDKMVNVQDVVACVNVILTSSDNKRADVNKDGSINVQDVVNVVNIILNKE